MKSCIISFCLSFVLHSSSVLEDSKHTQLSWEYSPQIPSSVNMHFLTDTLFCGRHRALRVSVFRTNKIWEILFAQLLCVPTHKRLGWPLSRGSRFPFCPTCLSFNLPLLFPHCPVLRLSDPCLASFPGLKDRGQTHQPAFRGFILLFSSPPIQHHPNLPAGVQEAAWCFHPRFSRETWQGRHLESLETRGCFLDRTEWLSMHAHLIWQLFTCQLYLY